jgi:hypothetical protein
MPVHYKFYRMVAYLHKAFVNHNVSQNALFCCRAMRPKQITVEIRTRGYYPFGFAWENYARRLHDARKKDFKIGNAQRKLAGIDG